MWSTGGYYMESIYIQYPLAIITEKHYYALMDQNPLLCITSTTCESIFFTFPFQILLSLSVFISYPIPSYPILNNTLWGMSLRKIWILSCIQNIWWLLYFVCEYFKSRYKMWGTMKNFSVSWLTGGNAALPLVILFSIYFFYIIHFSITQ